MATVTLAVLTGRMAGLTTYLIFVYFMGKLKFFVCVARLAAGTILDFLLRFIHCAVSVHFSLFVAIRAHHAFLIMDIGRAAVFTGKLGINPAAMTRSAGFAFIFLYEFMALQKAGGNTAHGRRFDMTTAAGGMTSPA